MSETRAQRLRRLFAEALERAPQDREAWLSDACGVDTDLLHDVRSLLAADDGAGGFLESDEAVDALQHVLAGAPDPLVGTTIGKYRIAELIARGGMGVVYRAEQDRPRRSVALKLISGALSSHLLRRFEIETQVLGQLQHAGIAQIFEAGTADTGLGPQPFFAMEFIEGLSLTDHARRAELEVEQRLELLVHVCEAVEHAHRNGVIHRDLKPANILIDASGRPKVLDFGVARSTDADLQCTTLHTSAGTLIGTLPYMSPEQVRGKAAELDTRSDVYALGVIAYELLTGRHPKDLTGMTIADALEAITRTDARSLREADATVHADLETIVAKALEIDRDRRYGSAAELAADIRRFLADAPIEAHPPSATYQLRKFARRNRALVSGLAIAFVMLLLGVIGTGSGWLRASSSQRAARMESARAHAVSEFLRTMWISPDPHEQGRDVRVVDVMAQAVERIDTEFAGEPRLQALLYETAGQTYEGLDMLDEAQPLIERAMEIRRQLPGPPDAAQIDTLGMLVNLHHAGGNLEQAIRLAREAYNLSLAHLDPDDPVALTTLHQMAMILDDTEQLEQAATLYREVIERSTRVLGAQHEETLVSLANLGSLLRRKGELEEARRLLSEVYEQRRRLHGEGAAETLFTLNNLAFLEFDLEHFEEADRLFQRSLDLRRRVFGPEHRSTAIALNNIGWSLVRQGRGADSEPHLREALALLIAAQGRDTPIVGAVQLNLGDALLQTGQLAEAEEALLDALPEIEAWVGPDHPRTLRAVRLIAEVYESRGRGDLAQPFRARLEAAEAG